MQFYDIIPISLLIGMEDIMKLLSIFTILAILPMASFANPYKNIGYAKQPVVKQKSTASKWTPRFFVEYDLSVYSEGPFDIEIEDQVGIKDVINVSSFNSGSGLYMGADFNGIQVGIDVASDTGFYVKGAVPFTDWKVKPFLSAELGVSNIDIDVDLDGVMQSLGAQLDQPLGEIKFDDLNISYSFGLGLKYDINDNFFVKLGAKYNVQKYDLTLEIPESEKLGITIDMSGMIVNFGIGYRF